MTSVTLHLPGRLGDPAMTLATDPRTDPRIAELFRSAGADASGMSLEPVALDAPIEQCRAWCLRFEEASEKQSEALYGPMPVFDDVEHWKLKCTLNKLLKELDIYSDIDLVVFEGNNNTMLHHNGAGILTYRNGAVFNGSFADGLKDGFGRYRCLFVTFVFCFILFHLTYCSLLPKVFLRADTSKDTFRMTS